MGSRLALLMATCGPTGFSSAVHLAQQASTAAVVEASGIAESELLNDRQVNLSLEHGARAFVYIDNIGLVGTGSWVASPTSFVREAC